MDSNGNVVLKTFRYTSPEEEERSSKVKKPSIHLTSIDVPAQSTTITADAFKFGIEVIDLRHRYGRDEPVLRGLTMKVEHGSIYGLLGASGCGKTTLLKCIIGMMVPDSGFIDVFGRQPRDPDSGIPGPVVGKLSLHDSLFDALLSFNNPHHPTHTRYDFRQTSVYCSFFFN